MTVFIIFVVCANSIIQLAAPLANKSVQASSVNQTARNDCVTSIRLASITEEYE